MIKYPMHSPVFFEEDVKEILTKIEDILRGKGLLSMGPHVDEFEKKFAEYIGTKYAVATNSCTAALEIALRTIGISEGDEVIVPVQTFVATGSAIVREGGKIVFAEIDQNTFCLSYEDFLKKITSKTKAVIIVYMAGFIPDYIWDIKKICKENNIYLIEDAAHAHGAMIDGIKAGAIGDIGCFSFYSTKIMTTGEGGILTTNNKDLYFKAKSYRSRGVDVFSNVEIYSNLGSNNRMTELQALLGLYQLRRVEDFIIHRNKIARIYSEELSSLENKGLVRILKCPQNIRHSYWRFIVLLNFTIDRNLLKVELEKDGIAIDWPYDPPLHLQPIFRKLYNTEEGILSNSENIMKSHICLPLNMKITEEDARFIASKLKKIIIKGL